MTAEEETITEKKPETPDLSGETIPIEEKEPAIKIKNERDLMRLLAILDGQNPDTQQTITDFMDMDNPVEKTNLPKRKDVQRIAYCHYAGQIFFPEKPNNAFNKAVISISLAFSAKGGEKSKQFVDIVRNTTDLSGIQGVSEDAKQGILDRVLRRGKE